MGVRVPQPDRRLSRRPLQPPPCHCGQPVRVVGRDLGHGPRDHLRATPRRARAHGRSARRSTFPAALALIADFHLGPTRSRAVGLHQMGIYAGVIIGGFSGYVADHPALGWRWAFDACGLVGVLYALPLFLLLRNPPRPAGRSRAPHTSPGRRAPRIARQRLVHSAGALFHAARAGRLGRARLDAGDSEARIRHRPGQGRRLRHALLAGRRHRRRRRAAAGWRTAGCAAPSAGASSSAPSACR